MANNKYRQAWLDKRRGVSPSQKVVEKPKAPEPAIVESSLEEKPPEPSLEDKPKFEKPKFEKPKFEKSEKLFEKPERKNRSE